MTTEVINIQIREDGSRVVSRNIEGIGKSADRTAGSMNALARVAGLLASAFAVDRLARYADEYTNLQNRLRLVTTGTENLSRVTKELLTIANATRSDFTATSELYARLAGTTKELGLSQQQMLSFTKSLNQAIVLSGATAAEAAGGLRQLSQGLASGTLRGDELNSVLENFPKVAQIIAEGMGKSIGQIRELGREGKISATEIINAFAKASDQLDKDFGTTVPTLSQSFTVLKNNFLVFIGQLNESTGITAGLSKLIITIANNLDTLIPLLASVAVGIAAAFVPGLITAFVTQIKALWVLLAAHPFVAIAAAIAGVVTYVTLMRDSIKLGIDETTTLGDLLRALWEGLAPILETVAGTIKQIFINFGIWAGDAYESVTGSALDSAKTTEATWLQVVRAAARAVDAILGLFLGLYDGIKRVFTTLGNNISQVFANLGAAKDKLLEGEFSDALAEVEKNQAVWKDTGAKLGTAMREGMDNGFAAIQAGGFESKLDGLIKRAQEIGKAREAAAKAGGKLNPGGADTTNPPGGDGDKKAERELERLKDALRSVRDQADPVGAAIRELADAQDVLTRSVKAGLISQIEAKNIYDELEFQMRDQLDPLEALNREMKERISLLKLSGEQAEIEAQVLQMTQGLRRDGVKLSETEIAQLRAKLVVEQELARIAGARDQIEGGSSKMQMRDASDSLEALKQVKDLTSGDEFNVLNSLLGGSLSETEAAFAAQIEQFQNYYAIIEQFRQQDVANEELASQAKRAIKQQEMDMYLQRTTDALGAAAGLMKSNSKEAFRIGQAAAIAGAIVNTYESATAAYASAAKIPYVGWLLGPAAAAGAVAAGMAQVSAIRSQQMPAYRTGGSYTIGGSGGVDSQVVSLRGTPGEQIQVNTPAQANAMANVESMLREERLSGRGRKNLTQNLTIVQQGKPNNRTPQQEAREVFKQGRKLVKVRN